MPVRNVLVCDTGSNIEHDDTTLTVNVVSITKTSELLLPSSIPDVELNVTQVLWTSVNLATDQGGGIATYGSETKRVNFDTESGDIFLFELTSQMALDKGGLFDG